MHCTSSAITWTTHKNKKLPFYCIGCLQRFSKKRQNQAHENECRRFRYECHLCKTFATSNKTHLKMHVRRHTGEKRFCCEVCVMYFSRNGNLERHLTIHSKSCNIYGKKDEIRTIFSRFFRLKCKSTFQFPFENQIHYFIELSDCNSMIVKIKCIFQSLFAVL